MATQAERATRRRDAERALQQRRAGAAPPASPPEPAERVLVVAYEEPDEAAWARAAQPAPVRTSAARHRATVKLDKALAQLPEGMRTVELTDDPQAMREHVAFCLTVAGWEAVQETYERLGDLWPPTPVAGACYEAADDAVLELSGQLRAVEERARTIISGRLKSGQEDLQLAAETFLTNLDIRQIGVRRVLETPYRDSLRLRRGPHIDALRELLKDLVPLNRAIGRAADKYETLDEGVAVHSPKRKRLLAEAAQEVAAARVHRARRVHETSGTWPLTAWMTDLEADVSDARLLKRVIDELRLVRDSIAAVRQEVANYNDWPSTSVSGAQLSRGVRAPLLAGDDLGPSPFTRNMRDPRGPWRYPLMIGRALDELGYVAPSPAASAAQEAMGGATATGLVWTLNGGIAVLGAVFPPAGVVLGATMAVWNLMVDLDEKATKNAAYRAILDPAQALDVEPSLRGVIAGVIGVVGSIVPGWSGFVIGGAEVVVRLSGEGG